MVTIRPWKELQYTWEPRLGLVFANLEGGGIALLNADRLVSVSTHNKPLIINPKETSDSCVVISLIQFLPFSKFRR